MAPAGTISSARTTDRQWLVELAGEHDLSTAPALREELGRVLADGASAVVDLSEVTFIDSSVVGVLLNAHRSTAGLDGQRVLVVAPASAPPARLLDFVGARDVLHVFASRASALDGDATTA